MLKNINCEFCFKIRPVRLSFPLGGNPSYFPLGKGMDGVILKKDSGQARMTALKIIYNFQNLGRLII
jgi:hypothetical protein